ncbi:MAG: hypothetical protein Q8P67_09095 [archaeon]|nr:hypothetical protein [archaeon]
MNRPTRMRSPFLHQFSAGGAERSTVSLGERRESRAVIGGTGREKR